MDDEKMHELVESIMLNGVLVPVTVRPLDDGDYEMISGHRRLFAVKEIGLERIPAIVKKYDDDELAEKVGESRGQLHRYLRLVELVPPILELVDKKALALATAVEVSFLDHEVQQMLYEYMCENEICKTFQIFALRDYLKENDTITKMELMRILNENAPKDESNRFQQLTITKKKLQEYFPTFYTKSQMEKVLFDLLADWKKKTRRRGLTLLLAYTDSVHIMKL